MKLITTVALALCLAASPVYAKADKALKASNASPGVVTKSEMTMCMNMGEAAELIHEAKKDGLSKRQMYEISMEPEFDDADRAISQMLIDAIYGGLTPDELFDLCLKTRREQ